MRPGSPPGPWAPPSARSQTPWGSGPGSPTRLQQGRGREAAQQEPKKPSAAGGRGGWGGGGIIPHCHPASRSNCRLKAISPGCSWRPAHPRPAPVAWPQGCPPRTAQRWCGSWNCRLPRARAVWAPACSPAAGAPWWEFAKPPLAPSRSDQHLSTPGQRPMGVGRRPGLALATAWVSMVFVDWWPEQMRISALPDWSTHCTGLCGRSSPRLEQCPRLEPPPSRWRQRTASGPSSGGSTAHRSHFSRWRAGRRWRWRRALRPAALLWKSLRLWSCLQPWSSNL